MSDFIFVYTTFANEKEAKELSHQLIVKKLAACVNISPVSSVYKWQGKIKDNKEWAAIIKTKKDYFDKVEEYILANHSYDTPCIIEISIGKINESYSSWLGECLK